MGRLLLGILKGAIIGGAVGYGAYSIPLPTWMHWLLYGVVGLVVGLFVGRPIWSHLLDKKSTVWTSILKGIFGFGMGVGLWALGSKALGDPSVAFAGESRALTAWEPLYGGIVGLLYGAWVELDDPPVKREKSEAAADKAPAKKA